MKILKLLPISARKSKRTRKSIFLDSGDCVNLVIENMELDNLEG